MIKYEDVLDQNPWWQGPHLPEEEALPKRTHFAEIRKGLERPFAQVLLGIRRVGKSTIVRQLIAELLEKGTDARRILYFSFDRYAVEKTPEALETVLKLFFDRTLRKKLHQVRARTYLFIDEIQYIDYWPDIIKRFYDQNKRLKFVVTGSQSTRLRGKSKGSLAGRLLDYHLPPLSFGEHLLVTGSQPPEFPPVLDLSDADWLPVVQEFGHQHGHEIERRMPAYLCYGQFPEVAGESSVDVSYPYIRESVLGKVLESDLPTHYRIEQTEAFKAMAHHLITNSGSVFETKNISSDLGLAKATAEKYLGYLKDSTLVNVVHNLTRSEIKKGRSLKKAYAGSPCFISAVNAYRPEFYDSAAEVFGKVVETYVWWRLAELFREPGFWRRRQDEVDFVVKDARGGTIPFEVKFTSRIRREDLKALLRFMHRRRISTGYVLTRSRADSFTVEGCRLRLLPYYLL